MTFTSILDTPVPVVPRPAPPRVRRAAWPLLVLAGWLAQAGIRLLLAHWQGVPAAFPDESGYLLAARWLAGGPGGDLSGGTFYQGGYPLLIAPAFWLSHDPQTCYRLVTGIGALVAAGVFPLGYAALRRFAFARAHAYPLAFGAGLLPAAVVFDRLALTDAILPTVVLAWLLALCVFLRSPGGTTAVAAGAAASLAASYAYTTHARGTVILAVHALVLAGLLVSGFVARRAALVAAAVAVVAAGAGWALNTALRAALYPRGTRDLGGILSSRLTSTDGLEWMIFGAAGQVWYLVVSTWGLAGLGLVASAVALFRRRTPPVTRIMAGVLPAVTLGMALASSAALPDEHRVGNYVYGRYLACLAVACALAGLAVLMRRRSLLTHVIGATIVLAGTALSVTVYAGDRLSGYNFIPFDFPETSFLTWNWRSLQLGTASLVAAALLALLVVAALTPRPAMTIAVGLTAFNLVAAAVICKPWGPGREAIFRPRPAVGGVAVDKGLTWRVWVRQAYQVWWTPITFFDKSGGGPSARVCMVVVALPPGTAPEASWPRHPAGWRVMTTRPVPAPWVAWRRTDCHRPVT
jgi:hypothetical protein